MIHQFCLRRPVIYDVSRKSQVLFFMSFFRVVGHFHAGDHHHQTTSRKAARWSPWMRRLPSIMWPSLPRQALHVVVRFRRPKRRTKRVVSQTSSEDVPETTPTPASTDTNEICVLDDNFAERYQDEARDDRPKRPEKKHVMLRFAGGRQTFSHRRSQFMVWKGQAASNAVKTLRGCYTLARRELASWRRSTKSERKEQRSQSKVSPSHRVSNSRKSQSLQRSRTNSRTLADSNVSIVSSLSSTTDPEEEQRKEQYRSDFSLPVRRNSSLEMKPSFCGFAETTSGSLERLLLVNVLALNESDEEDGEGPSTSRHLPFRSTMVNGNVHILKNEWV